MTLEEVDYGDGSSVSFELESLVAKLKPKSSPVESDTLSHKLKPVREPRNKLNRINIIVVRFSNFALCFRKLNFRIIMM